VDGEVGAEDRLDDERAQLAPLGEREVLEDVELGLDGQTQRNRRLGRPLPPKLRPLGAI